MSKRSLKQQMIDGVDLSMSYWVRFKTPAGLNAQINHLTKRISAGQKNLWEDLNKAKKQLQELSK